MVHYIKGAALHVDAQLYAQIVGKNNQQGLSNADVMQSVEKAKLHHPEYQNYKPWLDWSIQPLMEEYTVGLKKPYIL